jgi:hypothetical protein
MGKIAIFVTMPILKYLGINGLWNAVIGASAFECWRVWRPGDSVLRHFLYGSGIALLLR